VSSVYAIDTRSPAFVFAGSSKAITIFSQPKYPAAEVARLSTYMCLSESATTNKLPNLNEPLDQTLAPLEAAPNAKELLTPDDEVITRPEKQAAVVDLLARVSLRGNPKKKREVDENGHELPEAGLGVLPSHMTAVSSVLLFNSKENPYKQYKTINQLITEEDEEAAAAMLRRQTLSAMTDKQRRQAEEQARKLGIAPSSLYEGDNLPAVAALEYTYKPRMKELMAFELPSNLALPAIADISLQVSHRDVNDVIYYHVHGGCNFNLLFLLCFLQAELTSIAPSVIKSGASTSIPNVTSGAVTFSSLPANIMDMLPEVPNTMVAAPSPTAAAVAAPVAAAAPVAPTAVPPPVTAPVPPPAPTAAAPLPPPLPTAAAAAPAPAPALALPTPPDAEPAALEGRGGLLAALSNPDNIKKLKKASAAKPKEEKKPSSDDGEGGGGDDGDSGSSKPSGGGGGQLSLMDEMRLKMQMKRRAIAGNAAKDTGSGSGSSSATAAPPPPKQSSSSSSSGEKEGKEGKEGGGAGAAPKVNRPPLPALPSAAKDSPAASSSSAPVASAPAPASAPNTGLFNPDLMPGFRMVAAAQKKKQKKRKDSDDWSSTDEDSD
jgi:WAHD domain of WASH complex